VENPAGLSNHLFAIPVGDLTIVANDEANQYDITAAGGGALQGYRIDFKAQTGQVTSEDNGTAKGWSCTGTGRVEMNENDMAHTSRILHNSDQYLYFFATGKKVAGDGGVMQSEYLVIGNENGEAEWAVAGDTGTSRTDDHGQTFTVSCAYQLYPMTKWYGVIEQIDAD
jgi:hypothetical protein